MLTTLRIKNLALVDDLTVEFQPGFNALTGETGAGKSVIIGGIHLILGGRADKSLIRSGTDRCIVEAVFDVTSMADSMDTILQDLALEPCEENELHIKRSISTQGSSKQFINGSPCPVNSLSRIGKELVDIHGPHDAQSLNDPKRQIDIVDACGSFNDLRMQLSDLSLERSRLVSENNELAMDDHEFSRQLEILQFQVQEIQESGLQADDEENLENAYQRASNSAHIQTLCQELDFLLSSGDQSVITQLQQVHRTIDQMAQLDSDSSHLLDLCQQVSILSSELESEIQDYASNLDLDAEQLLELEKKFSNLQSLKKKYGPSIPEILDFGHKAEMKLQALQQREELIAQFQANLDKIDNERIKIAKKISKKRNELVKPLSKEIQLHLADLGFKQNDFEIYIESENDPDPKTMSVRGLDRIEFQFSPNPGEPLKALKAIASSGEMARVMLGIKTVLASKDSIPLLIFDEVDANVGGETASVVGEKLKKIGQNRQTICISHLPPVAAAAETHFVVEKSVQQGRTISNVSPLNKKDRINEIARMLGGTNQEIILHAKALLKK